jgi:hypothetical protein
VKVPPEDAWIIDFRADLDDLGRMLVTTPKIPTDRLALLREATRSVLTDPAVIAEARASNRVIDYRDAKTARQLMTRALKSVSPERKARVRAAVMEKFK